jgi:hypothetical protein
VFCKLLCATKELAMCLDLFLGRSIWCTTRGSLVLCGVGLCGFVHKSR